MFHESLSKGYTFTMGGDECTISYLPLSHVTAQVADIYMPIYSASTVYFAQPDALKGSLVKTLREVNPTLFAGVPRWGIKSMHSYYGAWFVELKILDHQGVGEIP